MKELLTIPIFFTLIFGLSLQLIDIAETTSTKATDFAEDMSNAMDCAMLGKNLSICSPDLMKYDFNPDAQKTLAVLEAFQEDLAIYIDIEDLDDINLSMYFNETNLSSS